MVPPTEMQSKQEGYRKLQVKYGVKSSECDGGVLE